MPSSKLHRPIFGTGLPTAVMVPHFSEKGYSFNCHMLIDISSKCIKSLETALSGSLIEVRNQNLTLFLLPENQWVFLALPDTREVTSSRKCYKESVQTQMLQQQSGISEKLRAEHLAGHNRRHPEHP